MRWGTKIVKYIFTLLLVLLLFILLVSISEFCFVPLSDVSYRMIACGSSPIMYY
jgi:hypothetical protein